MELRGVPRRCLGAAELLRWCCALVLSAVRPVLRALWRALTWQLTSSGEASFWVRASILAPASHRSLAQRSEPPHAAA